MVGTKKNRVLYFPLVIYSCGLRLVLFKCNNWYGVNTRKQSVFGRFINFKYMLNNNAKRISNIYIFFAKRRPAPSSITHSNVLNDEHVRAGT
jgi:hypothetical protein